MHSFQELSALFTKHFEVGHFPSSPASLYEPADYFLSLGAKRVRPVMCMMGNELFDAISADTYHAATAIELFHNFTLIHDDIMDKAPLRRGMQTVHARYGEPTALLAGDVMLVVAYDALNRIESAALREVITLFNTTAKAVCEGQQLDMDFEKAASVGMTEYIRMIELKTSVLLAASLQIGAVLGQAVSADQHYLYEFGRNLGISFQIQDDYLDAFGDPAKFGKQLGGDILADKKTFLMVKVMEVATAQQLQEIERLQGSTPGEKIAGTLQIFRETGVEEWARALKEQYRDKAFDFLEKSSADTARKLPLQDLADFLIAREH